MDEFTITFPIKAFQLARPSSEVTKLEDSKIEAQLELAKIKSVQLEFVKHSKLSRSIIKIEKQLEAIQAQYLPKAQKVRRYLRGIRVQRSFFVH